MHTPHDFSTIHGAVPKSASSSQGSRDTAVPLKVAIAYGSIPAGRRAISTMKRLLDQGGEAIHLFPTLWRFDLLADATCRGLATTDAVASDLLILVTENPDALPPDVESWVGEVLAQRRGTQVTVLAMWGLDDEWTISLYERNQQGRMQPTTSSTSSPAATREVNATRVNNLAAVFSA